MNVRIRQLRDLLVALDRADRKLDTVDPDAYRASARKAIALTRAEMGLLPITDFAGPQNALQVIAENLYFAGHRAFADLDGSGRAPLAAAATNALIANLCATSAAEVGQLETEDLLARLAASSVVRRSRRSRRAARPSA